MCKRVDKLPLWTHNCLIQALNLCSLIKPVRATGNCNGQRHLELNYGFQSYLNCHCYGDWVTHELSKSYNAKLTEMTPIEITNRQWLKDTYLKKIFKMIKYL